MWRTLNSPFVIALLAIAGLLVWEQLRQGSAARSARAFYEELIAVAEDASSDLERTQIVRTLISETGNQISQGFSAAFTGNSEEARAQRAAEQERYFRIRSQIEVTDPRLVTPAQNRGQESIVFQVTNGSDSHLQRVPLDIEFYQGDELIFLAREFGQSRYAPGDTRSFQTGVPQGVEFDSIRIVVTDIMIVDI